MSPYSLHMAFSAVEVLLGVTLLVLLVRAREFQTYWPMLFLAMWQALPFGTLVYLHNFGPSHHVPAQVAYGIYYFTYWISFAVEAICSIVLTYTILHGAMAPLQGLAKLVKIVYFWAAAISVLVALNVAFTPSTEAARILQQTSIDFQRATSIITVSLAVFVCIAIRPMGLSLKSRVFGTSFSLVIISLMSTYEANYFMSNHTLYSVHSLVQIAVSCVAECIWIYYFAVPEPKRKFVLLSTESPFHRWNAIAEQFGQSPGYVAIGGIPPDAFAGAEIEIFHRASAKMKELETPAEEPALPGPS